VREYWQVQAEADEMRKRQEEQLAAAGPNRTPQQAIAHTPGRIPEMEQRQSETEVEAASR
jgi:hypothetical protein